MVCGGVGRHVPTAIKKQCVACKQCIGNDANQYNNVNSMVNKLTMGQTNCTKKQVQHFQKLEEVAIECLLCLNKGYVVHHVILLPLQSSGVMMVIY
jgi:hypothetical protein